MLTKYDCKICDVAHFYQIVYKCNNFAKFQF